MTQTNKVLAVGSSELPDDLVGVGRELGQRLIGETQFTLVTGGLASRGTGKRDALDRVVASGALEVLGGSASEAHARIVTLLPESDVREFVRFSIGSTIRVAYADLRMRRYSMVLTSDAVVVIGGGKATKEIVDLAYVAGKPVLPVVFTGGAARDCWNRYGSELIRRLQMTPEETTTLENPANSSRAVSVCLQVLTRVLRPRCFVAMPFSTHPLPNVFETIRASAEDLGYQAVRVDQETFTGNIIEAIWEAIRQSNVLVADLTGHNPNVYYELGITHALTKKSLLCIYSEDGEVPATIPFDLRTQRIMPYGTIQSLKGQLKRYLPAAGQS
jgi:predicted Rossmann-fold nucleotide-binding protein